MTTMSTVSPFTPSSLKRYCTSHITFIECSPTSSKSEVYQQVTNISSFGANLPLGESTPNFSVF
ncbi:unnamed protein product [Tenebrio molitor]|nr:unnamed protein product [Tenebrio molitor]